MADDEPSVFRIGAVSYLRIPAADPHRAARFYERVFDWSVGHDREEPSFSDGSGHVIGHFVVDHDQPVAGAGGARPYVYVASVDETLERVRANGGEIARSPYPEGDLRVATFHDPEGNVVGVWQRKA